MDTLLDEIINKNKLLEDKIDNLAESNKEMVKVVKKAITTATGLIKYLIENHNTTPPLKKLNYEECIKNLKIYYNCNNNNFELQEKLLEDYKNNQFVKKISKSILKLLNHKNPDEQPIWNTDCARNHYVVKTNMSWNEDKAGIKFTEYVIKPLLDYIRILIKDYKINKIGKTSSKKFNLDDADMYLLKYSNVLDLECDLIDDIFIPQLLKELSPHLRYLRDEEIEQIENINIENIIHNMTSYKNDDNFDDNSDINSDYYLDDSDDDNYYSYKIFNKRII